MPRPLGTTPESRASTEPLLGCDVPGFLSLTAQRLWARHTVSLQFPWGLGLQRLSIPSRSGFLSACGEGLAVSSLSSPWRHKQAPALDHAGP